MEDKYLDLKRLADYSSLSVRTLRGLLSSIPHYKPGGKILVKKSDFDKYMERFRCDVITNLKFPLYNIIPFIPNLKSDLYFLFIRFIPFIHLGPVIFMICFYPNLDKGDQDGKKKMQILWSPVYT